MHPRRKGINHNNDLRRLEVLIQNCNREQQIQKRTQNPKSPDILQRIEEIKKVKELEEARMAKKKESITTEPTTVVADPRAVKVDKTLMKEIASAHQEAIIKDRPIKKVVKTEEPLDVNLEKLIIVEIKEPIILSDQNTGFSKFRNLQQGEKAIYLRDATPEEEEKEGKTNLVLLEFDDLVFRSVLNPEKNTNQYLVQRSKVIFPEPVVEEFSVDLETLRDIYSKYSQSLTNLGLLEFSNQFLNYVFEHEMDEFLYSFIEEIFLQKEPSLFNPQGFLKVFDNKPLISDPDELDQLLCNFINSYEEVLSWFKSL